MCGTRAAPRGGLRPRPCARYPITTARETVRTAPTRRVRGTEYPSPVRLEAAVRAATNQSFDSVLSRPKVASPDPRFPCNHLKTASIGALFDVSAEPSSASRGIHSVQLPSPIARCLTNRPHPSRTPPEPASSGEAPAWERELLERLAFMSLVEQRRTRRWNLVFRFAWIRARGGRRGVLDGPGMAPFPSRADPTAPSSMSAE